MVTHSFPLRRSMGATIIVVLVAFDSIFAAFPVHTFDSGNQGWSVAGAAGTYIAPTTIGPSASWDNRGNPGGALAVDDAYPDTWVAAPAAFLGNQSDMYGQTFSYDIRIRFTDGTEYPTAAITGAGISLLYTINDPLLDLWQTREVTFKENFWRVGTASGAVATQSQMQNVLGNLTGLYLLTEWHTGADDSSIDNVGVIVAPPFLAGDYNNNSVVDAADYILWRQDVTPLTNEVAGVTTNDTTPEDYDAWRARFSNFTPGGGGEALSRQSVPEPSTFLMLVAVAVGICQRRRRAV